MLADDRERELVVGAVMGRPGAEWARAVRSPEQHSSLIRRMWLRAIQRRAEGNHAL